MTPEERAAAIAALLRSDGCPDACNRWLSFLPADNHPIAAAPAAVISEETIDMPNRHNGAAVAGAAQKPNEKAAAAKRKRKAKAAQAARARPDGLRAGSKMATMLDMALRPVGATEAEICAAIGWKHCRVTLTRAAAKANYDLSHERNDEGEKVWKATPKAAK